MDDDTVAVVKETFTDYVIVPAYPYWSIKNPHVDVGNEMSVRACSTDCPGLWYQIHESKALWDDLVALNKTIFGFDMKFSEEPAVRMSEQARACVHTAYYT